MGFKVTWWQISILTTMEYFALMLLVCKIASERFWAYLKPILIYAPVYIALITLREFELVNDHIIIIASFITDIFFVKIVFSKKFGTALFIFLIAVIISSSFFQGLFTTLLGVYLSGAVEFTIINGLIIMILALISSFLCYLYLPLHKIQHQLEDKRILVLSLISVTLIKYFFLTLDYFEYLAHRFQLSDLLIHIGVSSLIATICYYTLRKIWRLTRMGKALKVFKSYKTLSVDPHLDMHGYKKHLQTIHTLSYLPDDSDGKNKWYIENSLIDFKIMGEDDLDPRFMGWQNKILAAYLYVKALHLRSLGFKCNVKNPHRYPISSEMETPKLLEALDIIIDEALAACDKERSDLSIVVVRLDSGESAIEFYNRNDFLDKKIMYQMEYEGYSFKNKKVRGLRKLNTISEEYGCHLSFWGQLSNDGDDYLGLRYIF